MCGTIQRTLQNKTSKETRIKLYKAIAIDIGKRNLGTTEAR